MPWAGWRWCGWLISVDLTKEGGITLGTLISLHRTIYQKGKDVLFKSGEKLLERIFLFKVKPNIMMNKGGIQCLKSFSGIHQK